MAEAVNVLSPNLFSQLQKEKLILLQTIDAETTAPSVNAISWVYAVDPSKIRFAVDSRSRIIANVKGNPRAAITLFAEGTVHAVHGNASIVKELEDVPFKLTCVEFEIEAVHDAMFYGARISVEPEYEKTYDKRAAEKLDQQVYTAMKKA